MQMQRGWGPQPSAPPPPAYPPAPQGYSGGGANALERVLARYEVSVADAQQLLLLRGFRIVFIADDSGSMSTPIACKERAPAAGAAAAGAALHAAGETRWDRLRYTIGAVVDFATALPEHGAVDVFFLNRSAAMGVTGSADERLIAALAPPPEGYTPLTDRVAEVVAGHRHRDERPLLLFIATDGEPSGPPHAPREGVACFTRALEGMLRRGGVRVQFLACTEDDEAIGWLHELDQRFDDVDVTEDYECERQEVLALGKVKHFSRGDWILKALLGSVSPQIHSLFHEPKKPLPCRVLSCRSCSLM